MGRRAPLDGDGLLFERPVQRQAIDLLARIWIATVHVPNGAHLAGSKLSRAKQMAALKRDGLRPGFPDLILFDTRLIGRIGFVECKRQGKVKLDPEQERWRDKLTAWGFPWGFISEPEDVLALVKEWGWR